MNEFGLMKVNAYCTWYESLRVKCSSKKLFYKEKKMKKSNGKKGYEPASVQMKEWVGEWAGYKLSKAKNENKNQSSRLVGLLHPVRIYKFFPQYI